MPKRKREPHLSAFQVAMEKGDYKIASELPQKLTFEDILEMYIILHHKLGCPDDAERQWLGIWKALKRDRKLTADELDLTEDAIRKRIARLKKVYNRKTPAIE